MKTTFKHLMHCALLLTLVAGCDWSGWGKGTGAESDYLKASGVNVLNCMVDDQPYKKGYAYAVFVRQGEGPWQPITNLSPITPNDQCGTSAVYIPFDSAGVWTVRAIQIDFGDPYGAPNQCDSSTGDAEGCSPGQYTTMNYNQDPSAPTATFTL